MSQQQKEPFLQTRGVVLIPEDLSLADWPERAKAAGLNTIALHPFPAKAMEFVRSEAGQAFLALCRKLGLQVEYELHAMRELLPRELFARNPELFRVNDQGGRTPDANLCVHSQQALEIAAENVVGISRVLHPTTGRYFYWGDDGTPWCRCAKCRGLSESDQALVLENHLLAALRREDPSAKLAHLAYHNTLYPPREVRPQPGIFLEYAPIHRRYDIPYAQQADDGAPDTLHMLDANLGVFGREEAQVLEYWLDVSRFSGWKRPGVRIPWAPSVLRADLDTYGSRGIRHLTSFAVWIDRDYVTAHGEPPVGEYGAALARWQPG